MALIPNNVPTRENSTDIQDRFMIAQGGKPSEAQLDYQAYLRAEIVCLAIGINENVADGRAKSLALTALEEALMWAGKAIFA